MGESNCSNTTDATGTTMYEPELSKVILDSFFAVYRRLGFGFLEAVYGNALCIELQRRGVRVQRQVPIEVLYEGVTVGTYRADVIANGKVLVETKATRVLSPSDERQVLNYLRATSLELAFLLHFGPEPKFRRWLLTNNRKRLGE